jgi:ADP-heptose:LPS heptosyltransferase
MDKIGDLVLTVPAEQHSAIKNTKAIWWVNQGTEFVLEHSSSSEFQFWKKRFSWSQFFSCVRFLKQNQIGIAVVFFAPWWVGMALFFAGVKKRVGRFSQWHSYLFFNRGVRQKRSRGTQHEMDFNWELMELAFGHSDKKWSPLVLKPKSVTIEVPDKYIIVHPGMAGSALNWSPERYIELIYALKDKFLDPYQIVITGTHADSKWTDPIAQEFKDSNWVLFRVGVWDQVELLRGLSKAYLVVAPSTGVLHLAASLGTRVVGIFSPKASESVRRWGPLGSRVKTVEISKKLNSKEIEELENLDDISVSDVLKSIGELE